jgi:hypothetical protein
MRKRESVWREGASAKAALVVAHPGHELRVYDWLMTARPDVHILTNGSRASLTRARREASTELVTGLGCQMRAAWDGVPDSTLYACLLARDHQPFLNWVSRLADDLVARDIDLVIADAWQYYNIAHDLAHLMARVAVAEASARLKRDVLVLEFPVVPAALAPTAPHVKEYCSKSLSARSAETKREVAHRFPGVEGEVAEVEALERGRAYDVERFYTPASIATLCAPPAAKPPYESYGEARVAAGLYRDVLRWEHAAPLLRVLADRYERCRATV